MQTLVYLVVFLGGVAVGWMLACARPGATPRTVYLTEIPDCEHHEQFFQFRKEVLRKRVRSMDDEEIKI